MGRAFFRCRLFWAPRILNASFESTLEIRDGIWWMLRLVAVLHLARWCYAHTNGEIWIMLMLFLLGNSEGNLWRSFRCRQQKSSSWNIPMFDLYIFFLVWSMVYIHLYIIYIYRTICNCMTWYVYIDRYTSGIYPDMYTCFQHHLSHPLKLRSGKPCGLSMGCGPLGGGGERGDRMFQGSSPHAGIPWQVDVRLFGRWLFGHIGLL